MSDFPQRVSVHLDGSAAGAVRAGAVRVFEGSVTRVRGEGSPGDIAVLYNRKDKPFALGVYDPQSPVRVRVLSNQLGVTIDQAFIAARVRTAVDARRRYFEDTATDGYRLIHGPGDGLPGLVVDRYANTAVLKCYAHAWLPWLPTIVEALRADGVLSCGLLRLSRVLQEDTAGSEPYREGQLLWGEERDLATSFVENGIRFEVDPRRGQKTGFFLDQRENRKRVEELSANARVLNVFCYTGGFSLYAARGGATHVVSIDASKQAMAALERNIALNPELSESRKAPRDEHADGTFVDGAPADRTTVEPTDFENICGDAFEQMKRLLRAGDSFDVVVIDPPSFAKKRAELEVAQRAYARLAKIGVQLTRDEGTLVFASCSSRITEALLEESLQRGARQARKNVRVVERTGHAFDHPVLQEEEQYLQCLYAVVRS